MWDFEHGLAPDEFDITYTLPSQCAAELQDGNADIGIIPAAAYATIPNLVILPGIAIAAKRAVRSILLLSRKPISEIRSVALDSSSLTSVALTRILFAKWWRVSPRFVSFSPDLDIMLEENDAALLIGDPALKAGRSKYFHWDLAEEWIRLTGKPFVFAFWAVREDAARNTRLDLGTIFQQSCAHGLQTESIKEIVDGWSSRMSLTHEDLRHYLTDNIHYGLDTDCIEGLNLFYELAQDCGALPHVPDLIFAAPKPVLTT